MPQIDEIINEILETAETGAEIERKELPYKTGNLSMNAYKYYEEEDGDDILFHVYIDESIAPYASYIDRPGFKTDGYWGKAMDKLINYIKTATGGEFE